MTWKKHELAHLQSHFYRKKYLKTLRRITILSIIILILIFSIIFLLLIRPEQKYYGNTMDGVILPMPTPLTGSNK